MMMMTVMDDDDDDDFDFSSNLPQISKDRTSKRVSPYTQDTISAHERDPNAMISANCRPSIDNSRVYETPKELRIIYWG